MKKWLSITVKSRTTWVAIAAIVTATCGLLGLDPKTAGYILAIEGAIAMICLRDAVEPPTT